MIPVLRTIIMRTLAACLLLAPAVSFVVSIDVDTVPTVLDATFRFIGELGHGRVSESSVLMVCAGVMIAAWLRITWMVLAVVFSAWRGRAHGRIDGPMTRMMLRLLMVAPVALNSATPRAAASAVEEISDVARESESHIDTRNVLLVSTAVAVGIAWRLRQRRLDLLRSDQLDGADALLGSDSPFEDGHDFESAVARHGEDLTLTRLDLAVRSLMASGHGSFRWIVMHPTGIIHVECPVGARVDGPSSIQATHPWFHVTDGILALDAHVTLSELSRHASRVEARLPILLPVGTTRAGSVWVNLESAGSFFVDGEHSRAEAVWDGLCQSLALSPMHMSVSIVGDADFRIEGCRQIVGNADRVARSLQCADSPVVRLCVSGSRRVMTTSDVNVSLECGLVNRGSSWLLLPMNQVIEPNQCTSHDREVIGRLVDSSRRSRPLNIPHWRAESKRHHPFVEQLLAETSFIVRVLGRPAVEHIEQGEVVFERSRSEELLVWLSLHPERRQRSTARSEMWSVPIKDATFSNVTSDVRRGLTACEVPPEGEQWLSVTMTEELPLHTRIVSDVDLLERCLDFARRQPEEGGAEVLSFGLDFVRGCPLEGSRYLWRDATGLSTSIAMLIVRAASMRAEMAFEDGDAEMLYASTAKGLLAVPGHEGLVALRMRQHARCGDRASLAAEWQAYCRVLACGDWGDSRPSQKMVDLWRSLSADHTADGR